MELKIEIGKSHDKHGDSAAIFAVLMKKQRFP